MVLLVSGMQPGGYPPWGLGLPRGTSHHAGLKQTDRVCGLLVWPLDMCSVAHTHDSESATACCFIRARRQQHYSLAHNLQE